jgi:hypothetical protein
LGGYDDRVTGSQEPVNGFFVPIIVDLPNLNGPGIVDAFDPHPQGRLVDLGGDKPDR